MQSKESSDANSELFKEDDDEAMYKNPYEIRLCDLISVSLDGAYRSLLPLEGGARRAEVRRCEASQNRLCRFELE